MITLFKKLIQFFQKMDKPLSNLSRAELDTLGFGPFGVEEVSHCYCTLPDGCKLALRIWAPRGTLGSEDAWHLIPDGEEGTERYPTVLEYLPYRFS